MSKESFNRMKKEIGDLLASLGVNPIYTANYDDAWQGFEFNINPRILIRFAWELKAEDFAGAYLLIDKWTITPYNNTVQHERLLYGKFIIHPTGSWMIEFYRQFLINYLNNY